MIPAGLADRGEIVCGAINRGLIYVGMPLNQDPPKNESQTTVPILRSIATGCQGCFSFAKSCLIIPKKTGHNPMQWNHVK